MKLNSVIGLLTVFSVLGCTAQKDVKKIPESISGIYPRLAYYNNEGECGTGAVVPWADRLWVVTYGPHLPNGSSDKLYEVTSDYRQIMHKESIGGTPANRMIHKESNQLFIGPYAIDKTGKVRVIPYTVMSGRHTGNARHLTDPSNKIYYGTMEEGFYEVDVNTLEVKGGVGKISTVMGRYYAMDRDNRWERVQLAYDAMVYGEGNQNPDPVDAVAQSYVAGVTDEFMEPVVCDSDGTVSDNDSVIFFNFRPDRAREITRAIVDPDFTGFQREFFPTTYVCNTEYDASMPNVLVAWPRVAVKNGLGEYLSSLSLTQLRIAETEKYAHVTFFFNGGVEKQYPGEDRVLVPSPKVATYDLQPEMSAYEVCDKCVERINSGAYDVVILNFANCDMVGHTGVLEAAVKAVETVDTCVGRVVEATLKMGGIAMITADHGNAEVMRQPDGSPMTAHTTNPVPFILCGAGTELRTGRLADIAPTILDVMGLACPPEMDGKSLIVR